MAILSLLAKLGLDKTGFDAGMNAAGKQVTAFGAHMKGALAGAFGAGALLALARETIAYGDSMKELGERLGVSSLEAQQFAVAAKLGGADMEFFASKFDKLKKAMSEAIGGGKNPLAEFGLSVEKLSQMRPADVVKALADHINDVGITADQAVKFVDIFGKGAGRMINILGDLQNAKTGTIFFSDADLDRLNKADDTLTKIWHDSRVGLSKLFDVLFFKGPEFIASKLLGPRKTKEATNIDEDQILTNQHAAEEAAKVHMAIMDRVAALDKEAAKLERDVHAAGLTDAQRKNELLKERVTLMENLRTMVGEMTPEEEEGRAMMRKRLAEVNLDLTRMDQNKSLPARAHFQIENTKLGSIGATLGNTGATRGDQMQAESLRTLKELKELLGRRGIVVQNWR